MLLFVRWIHYSHLPLNLIMRNARLMKENPFPESFVTSLESSEIKKVDEVRLKPQMQETEKSYLLKGLKKWR